MATRRSLTARFVQMVKPTGSERDKYWDQNLPAFGLFVYPAGRKTWNLFYRVNGRQKTKMIGVYPLVSLDDARKEARTILSGASKGEDLPARQRIAPTDHTFSWLTSEYLVKHAIPNKRQGKTDERLINKELLPHWGSRRPADITRQDVIAILDGLVNRGAPIQANRVHALISKVFNWAIERDLLDYNPCQQVKKPTKERQRERVLAPDEVKALWRAFGKQGPQVGGIMRLILITGQRRWEVSHMRWQDIDLEEGWWTIPGDFAKNGRSHHVPLTKAAVDIIKALPEKKGEEAQSGKDWVFPSPTREGQFINNVQKAKQRVDASAQVVDFVLHDLRRTAASYMAQEGVLSNIIGKVLNHAEPGVTRIYNRYDYDKEKREALETLERKLEQIIGCLAPIVRKEMLTMAAMPPRKANA